MIQGCLSEGGSIKSRRSDRRAMADSRSPSARPWRTRPGDRRQATHGQRHFVGAAHRRPLARHAGTVRQLEFCVRALLALEQARGVGRGVRNLGESRASGRRGTCHQFHDCAGASACSRRKGGNQNQEALGRSRGGFSTKVHLRTNAKGDPLTFDVTPGEAHEVKGYDALMELHDVDPDRLLGDKGYDSNEIRDDLTDRGVEPVIAITARRRSITTAKPTRGVISSSGASTASNNSVASPLATRKPPGPICRCYVSLQQCSG